jgi:hypothetical protein
MQYLLTQEEMDARVLREERDRWVMMHDHRAIRLDVLMELLPDLLAPEKWAEVCRTYKAEADRRIAEYERKAGRASPPEEAT